MFPNSLGFRLTCQFFCVGRLEDNIQDESTDLATIRRTAARLELRAHAIANAEPAAKVLHMHDGGSLAERHLGRA